MDTVMPGYTERVADLERGESLPLEELRGETRSETLEGPSDLSPGEGATSNASSEDQFHAEFHRERRDFDGGADALWSLYAKRAKTHDEARFESLTGNMDGAMLFAGLISAFLAPFLIESIHRLKSDPAQESVYYQKQSLAILAQISQQIASINPQGPIPHPPSLSYAPYKPSSSDIRVNNYWLVSLVCSLSAALL
ncbi:hypothetical protein BJY52DRAFT_1381664 [Lactarius psammicola]|nr:hypothetical protein BJY52DRAFT_1381664 [Lactarius psammicola]